MRCALPLLLCVSLCLGIGSGLLPPGARAQSSIGFSDPADTRNLLEYRLPDWGYRTLQANLDLGGSGRHEGPYGSETDALAAEEFDLRWARESERATWLITGAQSGLWRWRQTEFESGRKIVEHRTSAAARLGAETRRYGKGNLALLAGGTVNGYTQDPGERFPGSWRAVTGHAFAGLSWGRIRDVTPLLQAERVGERLRAIGHGTLGRAQVQQLASVLARSGGYAAVFDRPERQFWRDVLSPVESDGRPLSPFEVLYLSEVVVEKLGTRQEGWRLDITGRDDFYAADRTLPSSTVYPHLAFAWSRNHSLNSQTSVSLDAEYRRENVTHFDSGTVELAIERLWVIADRVFWSNALHGRVEYGDREGLRWDRDAAFRSACEIYVEDRVSLQPTFDLTWTRSSGSAVQALEVWSWSFRFRINYDLDRRLF